MTRFAARWLCIAALCGSMCSAAVQQRPGRRTAPRADLAGVKAAAAINEFFVRSDLEAARSAARASLKAARPGVSRPNRQNELDALFIEMEAASLQADTAGALEAALRLCEMPGADTDARVAIAAARILDLAANSVEFRPVVPRVRALIASGSAQSNYLRSALLAAASDGMSGLSFLDLARESGLLTDWRVAGPFGKYSAIAFDRTWAPERDGFVRANYDDRPVERFRFNSGTFNLPEYFPTEGVLYATADATLPVSGQWRLRVESAGSLRVFVDGVVVLTKDDRFQSTPEVAWQPVRLACGTHRVLVKFAPSAAPFRIALLKPEDRAQLAVSVPNNSVEASYVNAALAYWTGDFGLAIEQLTELRRTGDSAAVDILLADAWSHAAENSPQRTPLLKAALALSPSALIAEYELAEKALAAGNAEEALRRAKTITQSQPKFELAIRVVASAAARLNLQPEAVRAYKAAGELHASCNVLGEAAKFLASIYDYDGASQFESRLEGCAPDSLTWAQALSDAGRHAEAAAAADRILARDALNRNARELLVRELTLAGESRQAKTAVSDLVAIAPNSSEYRRIAQSLDSSAPVVFSANTTQTGFADARQFYAPYRRDAISIIKQTEQRHFSGGPAVTLLHDRVAQLRWDGSVALYAHKVTRVLDRDGILQFGEVSIPEGASILELRTIKVDGTIAEPEFNKQKATISMPALSPGDAIDVEYVIRYPEGGLDDHEDAFQFTFGSFAAPILYARFVVVSPADAQMQFDPSGAAPSIKVENRGDEVARVWEKNDIPQSTAEVAMPRTGVLPSVRVLPALANGWTDVRDFYREALITAARVGSNTRSLSRDIVGANDEERLRAAYRLVTSRVRSTATTYTSAMFPSAESTFTSYSGSRTLALLALGQAMGINGKLLMARDVGNAPTSAISPQVYSRPLAIFRISELGSTRDIVLDPEDEGLGFGAISPTIERSDALFVPLLEGPPTDAPIVASIPEPLIEDHSLAEADVTIDAEGHLSAHTVIRMGAGRSAQMRSILGAVAPEDRKHFFEQLAMRIFPGASDAEGEVHNESDLDRPLELVVNCRAPRFIDFRQSPADLDQLVPALGLRKMYLGAAGRRTALYIATPLFETATFHIRLAEPGRFTSVPADMMERNEFGSYSVSFHKVAVNAVDIQRDFHIPVQVIAPGRFDDFSRFARRVDDAERQRLSVETGNPSRRHAKSDTGQAPYSDLISW